jgi:26 proteasome complex subunit DSS1
MSSQTVTPKSSDPKDADKPVQKPNVSLEEDDEFEDFPVEDWEDVEAEAGGKGNLWEESWDDDDTSEDFSAQLREELKKTNANKS